MSFASGLVSCFTYPLNVKYLLVIGGAALFTVIVSMFPLGNDIGYWFILLVVARVGFDIIDRFAAGHTVHAETPHDFPSGGFARPLKYWLILVGMDFLIARYMRKYGYAAGLGIDIVTSLILPGMTIVLAMTKSLRSAFNPAEWLRVARAAPGTFVLLAFLSLGIDQLTSFANDALFPDIPENAETLEVAPEVPLVPIAAYTLLMVYLWLVNFCMIGLAVHANRDALEVDDGRPSGTAAGTPAARESAAAVSLATRVREALARGQLKEAEDLAYDAMRDDPYDAHKHALYHQALMANPQKGKAMFHAQRYISLLVKAGDQPRALEVFRECVAADPAFRPVPDEALTLARAARSESDPHTAVALLSGFDKANAGHPDIPQVYLFSAQLMAEDLSDRDMARRILQHILNRYPGHSIAPEAKRCLDSMQ